MNEHKVIVDTDADRNHDGNIDFEDLPPETRDAPPVGEQRVRYDDEVEDDRSNIRRLKALKAQDVLDERARRRKEAEADAIIEEERQYQRDANPSTGRRIYNLMESGYNSLQRQRPAPQRRTKGKRSTPLAFTGAHDPEPFISRGKRERLRQALPQPRQAPAPSGDRLKMFSMSVMGGQGITVNSPAPKLGNDDQLKSFTAGLLGGTGKKRDKKKPIFKLI